MGAGEQDSCWGPSGGGRISGTADDVSFTYDNFGRVLTTAQNGKTITNVYDALSRRLSETTANGTVSYGYDIAGRGTKITYPGSSLYVNYDYNVVGQVTAIRENGATSGIGVLASYTYDNQGRRTSVTRGNGVVTNLGFDVLSRLTSLQNDVAGTSNDQTLTFTHMASSQIATRTNSNPAYDWDGATILSESYSINGLNQVLSAAIGNITYDARGNTVAAGSKTYGYDIFNQLTSAVGSGVNASMDYDPVGRLAEVTGSGVTTKFVYSGSQMIAETNSSGTTLRRYVHGPGTDEPIVWYEGSGTTDRRWLMSDNQGSITAITNSAGAVTAKNRYNEYGVPDTANTGRFQYTGQMWLAEADIYHYKARAYDPYLGRFLQTDPIGYAAGMNVYAYVGGDPVNYSDPSGLKEQPPCPTGQVCVTAPRRLRTVRMNFVWERMNFVLWLPRFSFNDGGGGGGVSAEEEKEDKCLPGVVKVGNHMRNLGALEQQASGVLAIIAVGSVFVTVATEGATSPVTVPVAAATGTAAGDLAAIGTGFDIAGAAFQSYGTNSWTPLRNAGASYLSGKALQKYFPKISQSLDGSSALGGLPDPVTCG